MALNFTSDIPAAIAQISGWYTSTDPLYPYRNADNDTWFYCQSNSDQGVLKATVDLTGVFYTGNLSGETTNSLLSAVGSISGTLVIGFGISPTLSATGSISGDFYSTQIQKNFVAWSKIGNISFVQDQVNDSGHRPMPWQGWVYQIKQLGKNLVVYGQNGITMMSPVGSPSPTFGFVGVSEFGLLAKNLVAGDLNDHYFIDAKGQLWNINSGSGLKLLGYEEFLSPLNQDGKIPIMLYDDVFKLVYICNGVRGFIYNSAGLGGGPINVVGLYKQGKTNKLVYAGTPNYGYPELCTEIQDMGLRDVKALYRIAVFTQAPSALQYAIDYRSDITQPFTTTSWANLKSNGDGWMNISAREFRIKLRSQTQQIFQLDDIEVYYRIFDRTLHQEAAK